MTFACNAAEFLQDGSTMNTLRETLHCCLQAMGDFGAKAILAELAARGRSGSGPVRALTHCNTGSLATAAYGTALGVVRALAQRGALEHAFCTETRPYNQGATLQQCQQLSSYRLTGRTTRLCKLLTATRLAGPFHCLLTHRNRLIVFAI